MAKVIQTWQKPTKKINRLPQKLFGKEHFLKFLLSV
jgi:hypothetical protein